MISTEFAVFSDFASFVDFTIFMDFVILYGFCDLFQRSAEENNACRSANTSNWQKPFQTDLIWHVKCDKRGYKYVQQVSEILKNLKNPEFSTIHENPNILGFRTMRIPIGIPIGIPMGIPIGTPMGILWFRTMWISVGFPIEIRIVWNSRILGFSWIFWFFQLSAAEEWRPLMRRHV